MKWRNEAFSGLQRGENTRQIEPFLESMLNDLILDWAVMH